MRRRTGSRSTLRPPVWRSRRPLFVVGLVALAATGMALSLPVPITMVLAAVLVLVSPLPLIRRVWWVLITAAVFLLCTAGHRHLQEAPLRPLIGQSTTITAQVVDIPNNGQMYTVRVTDSDRIPIGTRLSLYCAPGTEPLMHDTVCGAVTLKEVPRSSVYRRSARTFLYAFPTGAWDAATEVVDTPTPPPLYALRQYFSRILQNALPDQEGVLLAAICLGERRAVSAAVTAQFRNSGLSHLLVVSGLHLSVLAVTLYSLLRRIGVGYRTAAGMTLPFVWIFAGMIGGTSSVLRASLMCSLWLLSFVVYRRYDGLTSWGLAAACLLSVDPYRLLNAGFQLSFAATAGVLILAPRLCRPRRRVTPSATALGRLWQNVCRFIRNGCGVCMAALLFTLPLSVFYYHGLSLTALPANLLTVVPAGWALTVGWLGLLCGTLPFLGWLSRPLLYAAGWLTRYLQGVAALLGSNTMFAPLPYLWQKLLIAALCGVVIVGILCRIPWRRVVAVVTALALTASAAALPLTTLPRLTVLACGDHTAVWITQRGRTALITDHSGTLAELSYTLTQQGIARLDHLIIDDGSTADGGTLTHLWEQYGHPTVSTATDSWAAGLAVPVSPIDTAETRSLWDGCTLTRLPDGWWRLNAGGGVLLSTDPTAPRPESAALTVYTGLPKQPPTEGYCILSCRRDTTPQPLTDHTLYLIEESITLTARKDGEWSVLPWL